MIKLFEEYNSFYEELSDGLKNKMDEYSHIPFTEKEFLILKDLLKLPFRYFNKNGLYIEEKDYLKCCMIYIGLPSSPSTSIIINKYSDEWFLLTIHVYTYFKCDQFEGLLKCIKDKLKL